jgi:hypothetical protein
VSLARWLSTRLVHVDDKGKSWPPGGGRSQVWKQSDDNTVMITAHGDAFDLYIGRHSVYNITLEPKTALRLARWLIAWWALTMWFGLKGWLWQWTMTQVQDERSEETTPRSLDRAR